MSDRGEALADHVGLLVARVKELEAQLAVEKNAREEAEKDTARLDWLERNIWNGDMLIFPSAVRHGIGITHRDDGTRRHEDFGDNVRAAIDAARSLQGQQEQPDGARGADATRASNEDGGR